MFLSFAQTNIPPGDVSGTWGISGSPYNIQGDITIPNDSTLTIKAGVQVEFQGHYALNVQGRLLAVGTQTSKIKFTVNDTTGFHNPDTSTGGWNGIQFIDTPVGNDTSKIIYCTLQYGKAVGSSPPDNAGGAIFISAFNKVLISNCLITYNSAGGSDSPSGGGLGLHYANINLVENEISHNRAWDGGGIKIWEADPVFIGNLIDSNQADEGGGGVWIGGLSNSMFNYDIITNNTAGGNGGGIICWQTTSTALNTVNVFDNSANWGGGLGVIDCEMQINNCNIINNAASWIGGGINAGNSNVKINNSNFERNTAYIFGGAMGIYNSELTINSSSLTDNGSGILGGAIHSDFSTINLLNTTFERDTAGNTGGGLFLWHCDLQVDDCEFNNDSAAFSGGAIAADSSSLIINGSTFSNNSGLINGGAIISNRGFLSINNCSFLQNTSVWGGAVISDHSEINLKNIAFEGNTAEHGGALSIGWCDAELKQISFAQNSAIWGGGISSTNCNLFIDSCLFSQNNVTSEAGAIECLFDTLNLAEKLSIQINNSEFLNNSSGNLFAGIKIRQDYSDTALCSVRMDKNLFKGNTANSYSAIRFIGNIDDIIVNNSIFEENFANQFTSIFSANRGAKVKVNNSVFAKNYPRAASLNINARMDFMSCSFANNYGTNSAALSLRNDAEATITNSILWNNGNNPILIVNVGTNGSRLNINYSDIQYGTDSLIVPDSLSILNWGIGNIDNDPVFVDTLSNDFHLQNISPCLAAGIDSIQVAGIWQRASLTDIEGNLRPFPVGTMPDMGAYESHYPVSAENFKSDLPDDYILYQNFPNPFNNSSEIKYSIPNSSKVILKIFNILGNEITTLVDEQKAAGIYVVKWVADDVPSGVYFYQIKAGNFNVTKKMILLK